MCENCKIKGMNYYTIKDLETLSGIKAHTIRIWEKRYGLLIPSRTATNIRYYSDDELKRLLNISLLVKNGYKISKVSGYDDQQIYAAVLSLSQQTSVSEDVVNQLVVYMVNFDDQQFEALLDRQIERTDFEQAIVQVIFPLFEKIGIFWQIGSIFPAQEHFVSNMIRQRLIAESAAYRNYQSDKTILFFLPEKEMHELGLLFYNYLALKSGYRTIYLGQNVPFGDLPDLDDLKHVDYIFTSFVNAIEKDELEDYLARLSTAFKKKKIFITGAQVLKNAPALAANVKVISDIGIFKKYFAKI